MTPLQTTVAEVCAHRTHFEHVRRAGVALMERAPKHERKEIETEIVEFRKRYGRRIDFVVW